MSAASDLIEAWDLASMPDEAGCHDGAGFAAKNWRDIRQTLETLEAEASRCAKRADEAWRVIDSDYWRTRYDEDMARGNAYVEVLRIRLRAALRVLARNR